MDKVRDIMAHDIISVPSDLPVAELVSALDRAGITGAPVVEADGRLVGVITVRDVIRLTREISEVPEAARWGVGAAVDPEDPTASGFVDVPLDAEFHAYLVMPGGGFVDLKDRIRRMPATALEGYTVRDIMTEDPVQVRPSTDVGTLARLLVDRKIHRALVVDEGRLVGIVSATDVLRAVADGFGRPT